MTTSTPTPLTTSKLRSRPSAGPLQSTASPHTPLSRSVSGLYGSPGSSFRIDDENLLVFSINARSLLAGFAGEAAPRCVVRFAPGCWRRAGDYREFDPSWKRIGRGGKRWSEGYELWESLDVRDLDLGVVEDRVERVIRDAEAKYLLLDNRAKRVALTVPSDLPRPILTRLLRQLFEVLQASSITLLPSSVMACVGAGVRSALVVEMGWEECVVTAVGEYREVSLGRSIRAGKKMLRQMQKILQREVEKQGHGKQKLGFEEVEEALERMAWCRSKDSGSEDHEKTVTIPIAKTSLNIPFHTLSEPAETTFFASDSQARELDTHDLPTPQLLFRTLLQLPMDIRNLCLNNIIFTGDISTTPGLRHRIIAELQALVESRGWDEIREYGANLSPPRRPKGAPLTEMSGNVRVQIQQPSASSAMKVTESTTPASIHGHSHSRTESTPSIPAHMRPHDTNTIDAKLASLSISSTTPYNPPGSIRAINTLGGWAGASLLTNLRIKGVVEVEKERFLQYGLVGGSVAGSGAKPGMQIGQEGAAGGGGYARSRQSLGAGLGLKTGEKSTGWSLGVF